MTDTNTPAERSAAFDEALQNAGHALMLPDPVPAMARVLTAFRDEYRAELLAAATVPAPAPTDRSRWQRYADAMDAVTGGTCPADLVQAVIAVADAEQAGLRTAFNNQLDLFANEYDRHREEERRLRDATDQHRLALSQALGLGTGAPWDAIHDRAGELPAPADRAAILREVADALPEADLPFVPPMDRRRVANWLRRLADAASGPGRADDKASPVGTSAVPANESAESVAPGRADGKTQQDETPQPCKCSHPADEHSVYGCTEDCGCEWMPKRRPAKAQQPECACDPAPHREDDGTYSHWAGCPIADAQQAADVEDEEPTEEQIVREHVTTVHLIGEQLADIESWLWKRLAEVRAEQPAAVSQPGKDEATPCSGFPDSCPNLRPVLPTPGGVAIGIRCGCTTEQPAVVSQPDGEA